MPDNDLKLDEAILWYDRAAAGHRDDYLRLGLIDPHDLSGYLAAEAKRVANILRLYRMRRNGSK